MKYLDIVKSLPYLVIKGNIEQEFNGKIRIDSRLVKPGDIFVAIVGNKVDGHDYINSAINNGAKGIITEKDITVPDDIVVIKVPSTKDSLLLLAALIRKFYNNIPLIAVTGSVGKTTTKELIYYLLSNKYKVLRSKGNHNNYIGVPLTLFELDNTYDICVLELGMNHLKEIEKLSNICLPTDAVITLIGTSHIGLLGSKDNIFKAKMEITSGLGTGTLFVNGDDSYLKKIKSNIYRIIKCGLTKNNDIRALSILSTDNNLYFKVNILDKYYKVVFPIPNEGLVNDILLATGVALKYNVKIEDILNTLENYPGIENRNQIIKLNNNITLIDDSYNSSFESLKAGLKMLESFSKDKIVIIGDILELGSHSIEIHKKIKGLLKDYDKVILVGNYVKNIVGKNFIYCSNALDTVKYLETINLNDKVIYVKASHALGLSEVVESIKKRENSL